MVTPNKCVYYKSFCILYLLKDIVFKKHILGWIYHLGHFRIGNYINWIKMGFWLMFCIRNEVLVILKKNLIIIKQFQYSCAY